VVEVVVDGNELIKMEGGEGVETGGGGWRGTRESLKMNLWARS
jgi:hypothetical protein